MKGPGSAERRLRCCCWDVPGGVYGLYIDVADRSRNPCGRPAVDNVGSTGELRLRKESSGETLQRD